jgi:hypothetical protein
MTRDFRTGDIELRPDVWDNMSIRRVRFYIAPGVADGFNNMSYFILLRDGTIIDWGSPAHDQDSVPLYLDDTCSLM